MADLGIRNGGKTITPAINQLINDGVTLSSYYTFRVCAPTRASIQTGRYPWGVGFYDMSDDGSHCVDPGFKMMPQLLKEQGYSTHALGKVLAACEKKPGIAFAHQFVGILSPLICPRLALVSGTLAMSSGTAFRHTEDTIPSWDTTRRAPLTIGCMARQGAAQHSARATMWTSTTRRVPTLQVQQ